MITSPYLALLVCLLLLTAISWLKRRKERERLSLPVSAAVVAAALEKFNPVRSSECVQSDTSGIRRAITNEPMGNQAAAIAPNESIDGMTLYAKFLAVFAWLWLLAALPFVTDAACEFIASMLLAVTWMILAFAWLCGLLAAPFLFRSASARKWWFSAGLAGILGLLLAFTDVDFMLRVALSERALSAHVASVPPGTQNSIHPNRLVGLFLVDGTEESGGAVFLYTSSGFLDRYGVAYVPDGAIPPSHLSMKHLFGPWYHFKWRF